MGFGNYRMDGFWDEMFTAPNAPRPINRTLFHILNNLSPEEMQTRQQAAERALLHLGITFNVYGDERGMEKIFPFDILPRIIEGSEWDAVELGLKQRLRALNLFLDDIYHDQKILKDKVVPREVIDRSVGYTAACAGIRPPLGVWCHISGTDLVRDGEGRFMVLEDNLRCPSGVSYVLGNRSVMKRTFPRIFEAVEPRPVDDYPSKLLETLQSLAPWSDNPRVALLTPGMYNSAYFEHSFLAQQMGIELVTGPDLSVRDGMVYMRTTRGYERIDVLYRRIDDDFLDPKVFRADSVLGVAGLMDAYRRGKVALVNAPGTGVADDKVIYAYVPRMIRYYLDEEPILPNVETWVGHEEKDLAHILANMDKLVIKTAEGSGGYGVLIGPHADKATLETWRAKVIENPSGFIAQTTLSLSRSPVLIDGNWEGRHIDLRPFALFGKSIYVLPGGLTRVALRRGSLVVNSSQGGGSKDTWVVPGPRPSFASQSQTQGIESQYA
jgi:uncharacterized circularly permuted ATP-grasp superfamily protein